MGERADSRTRRAGIAAMAALASVVAALCSQAAAAEGETASGPWRGGLQAGAWSDTRVVQLTVARDWPASWPIGGLRLAGSTALTLGRWQVDSDHRDGRAGFTQIELTPMLRLWLGDAQVGGFGEAGLGAAFITPRFRTTEKAFSTRFNFGDHLGLGWRWPGPAGIEAGVVIEHYSNASIKRPNPGQNFLKLRLGAAF